MQRSKIDFSEKGQHMYQIAICEDDEVLQRYLGTLCEEVLEELHIPYAIKRYFSAENLEADMEKGVSYDILLLDIILKKKTGMDLAKELRRKDNWVSILFVTGAEEYLSHGYSVQPIQFLTKPVSKQKLKEALELDWRRNHSTKTLSLQVGSRTHVLFLPEIRYIEANNHSSIIWFKEGTQELKLSLSKVEKKLQNQYFCRCHNSYLVNVAFIQEIKRTGILLSGGIKIPVGRSYYEGVQNSLIQYMN